MSYGCQSMTGTLERVLVRPPQTADAARWREYGWRAEPDLAAAAVEHEALRALLRAADPVIRSIKHANHNRRFASSNA